MGVVSMFVSSRSQLKMFCLHVKWEENSKAVIVLQALQIEVLLEMVKPSISNIGAIQETQSMSSC